MRTLSAFVVLGLTSAAVAAEPDQTVFVNGNIYTMNERQPHAEAIAVKGDRIEEEISSGGDHQRFMARRRHSIRV